MAGVPRSMPPKGAVHIALHGALCCLCRAVLCPGAITWHAHPHNAQYELYDPSLLEFSVDLVHDLDRRFGFKPKHTIILVSTEHRAPSAQH